ncbi:MAG: MFS transporter [Thermodesulfobacteriota bacterium]
MTTSADTMDKALRYRWIIFWILALGYILVYFHRLCPAVVAVDMMQDLKAGGALTGLLAAAYFYPYAVMQLPAGLLSDSWGPRNTITLFFGVAFVGSIILGLAPSVSWAIFGRALVGLGVAMLFVPTMKVLAEWFRVREFATMTGILIAMGGIGSLTAATPLAMMSAAIGWRKSFLVVGGFTFLIMILVWMFVRDRPSDFGWLSPAAEKQGAPSAPIGPIEGVRKVLSTPSFWPVACWFFFDCAIFFSFGGLWGGPYLMQIYGLSKSQAGQVLSMLAIGMIVGSPILSHLSNHIFHARKPVMVLSGVITLMISAVLAFYTDKIPLAGLYVLCLVMGCFTSAVVVVAFTISKELFPVQIAGTATGLVNLFPFAGGAVFQPVLGYVLESQGRAGDAFTPAGYRQAFLVLFACGVITFLSSLRLKETLAKNSKTRS